MSTSEATGKYQHGEPPQPNGLPPEVIVSEDTRRGERLPPGQVRTRKWPVLQYGRVPQVAPEKWSLTISGLVDAPLTMNLDEFRQLPRVQVFSDFHCVTRWSRLGNLWEGVATREIAARCGIQPSAQFVILKGYDEGWTTNLPLEDFLAADALLADLHDGAPLSADHGGPVRLVVPHLYAWKSAKWLRGIEFAAEDWRGYWEEAGYHDRGDPWREERYRDN